MRALAHPIVVLAFALFAVLGLAVPASAQTFNLTVTPATFTYPSADPDTSPTVVSPALTISYRVRNNGGHSWTLTVRAMADLTSGSDTIPSANITWTATPAPPFVNGTLSTVAQTLATGTGNVSPARTGSMTLTLKNLWTYGVGTYTHTLVFTLTSP